MRPICTQFDRFHNFKRWPGTISQCPLPPLEAILASAPFAAHARENTSPGSCPMEKSLVEKRAIREAASKLGYPQVKQVQEEVVLEFLSGHDVFVSLPTGEGKSLCYAILPWTVDLLEGREGSIVVVVSPLIALMQEQVAKYQSKGLNAQFVGSGQTDKKSEELVEAGQCQLVFISPEALVSVLRWREMFRNPIYQSNLRGLVVDECHLCKAWGLSGFRKEYAEIGEIRSLVPPGVHIMALTATATSSTRKAVMRILGMKHATVVNLPAVKPNISFHVSQLEQKGDLSVFAPIVHDLVTMGPCCDKTIIFCRNYKHCDDLLDYFILSLGSSLCYPPNAPKLTQNRLIAKFVGHAAANEKDVIINSYSKPNSTIRVLICTVAFGMGMDVPNVRKIVHWLPPEDTETYIQECGRAGRDGLLSEARLYFHSTDLTSCTVPVGEDMIRYCTNTSECRRSLLADMFECEAICVPQQRCCDVCSGSIDASYHSSCNVSHRVTDPLQCMDVSDVSTERVRKAMQAYRDSLCPSGIPLILGVNLSTGLTPAILDKLATIYSTSSITCADDLMALVPISRTVAVDLFEILKEQL